MPLFEVISAYLDEMEAGGAPSYWDEMTEFLLLMSLLVEIKSRLLLPGASRPLETETHSGAGPRPAAGPAVRVQQVQGRRRRLRELGRAERRVRCCGCPSASLTGRFPARRRRRQRGRHAAPRELCCGSWRIAESRTPPTSSRPRWNFGARPGSSAASWPGRASSRSTRCSAGSSPWCRPFRCSPCSICSRGARSGCRRPSHFADIKVTPARHAEGRHDEIADE